MAVRRSHKVKIATFTAKLPRQTKRMPHNLAAVARRGGAGVLFSKGCLFDPPDVQVGQRMNYYKLLWTKVSSKMNCKCKITCIYNLWIILPSYRTETMLALQFACWSSSFCMLTHLHPHPHPTEVINKWAGPLCVATCMDAAAVVVDWLLWPTVRRCSL